MAYLTAEPGAVTVEQIQALWRDRAGLIDRPGGELSPVTIEDLDALAAGGGLDLDDEGQPADQGQWQVLADQINSDRPGYIEAKHERYVGEIYSAVSKRTYFERERRQALDELHHARYVDEISCAISNRDRAAYELGNAKSDTLAAIRAAIEAGVPVKIIAETACLSVSRIYQIRDGRR